MAEHPLRERLRGQLMLALYRSGRQAEALDAYRGARRVLATSSGSSRARSCKRLEQAILEHDPALDLAPGAPAARRPPPRRAIGRSVVPEALDGARAGCCGSPSRWRRHEPPRELIVAAVVGAAELEGATAALARAARAAARARRRGARPPRSRRRRPASDVVRLAAQEGVDLLLTDAGGGAARGRAASCSSRRRATSRCSCRAGASLRSRVRWSFPFGAASHDWAALELGAWVARATDSAAAADRRRRRATATDGRDASRLLADASLIVAAAAPAWWRSRCSRRPGRSGVMALAEGAGLLVVGLSDRWRDEGLGPVRSAARRGAARADGAGPARARPGGMAPAETPTRFGWSLTVGAP